MNILLVEDDRAIREPMAEMLRKSGYKVEQAEDGFDAIARGISRFIDVVITDCEMPRTDGVSLIKYLKGAGYESIPIIAMSGSIANMKLMMDAGANAFLLKPINFNDLLACITLQAGKAREAEV